MSLHDSTRQTTEVDVRQDGGVLTVRLVGGRRRNVLGKATIAAIDAAITGAGPDVRAVLITAEGPDFCAGYDLAEAAQDGPEGLIARPETFTSLRTAGVPIVVALHGNVIGGGLELALSADLRLASPDAKFSIPAARIGLVYSAEGARLLVDELGATVARSMLVGGRVIDAQSALGLGVVAELAAANRLDERALACATEIAKWPALAARGNRELLDIVAGRVSGDAAALRSASMDADGALAQHLAAFAARRSVRNRSRLGRVADALRPAQLPVVVGHRVAQTRHAAKQALSKLPVERGPRERLANVTRGFNEYVLSRIRLRQDRETHARPASASSP